MRRTWSVGRERHVAHALRTHPDHRLVALPQREVEGAGGGARVHEGIFRAHAVGSHPNGERFYLLEAIHAACTRLQHLGAEHAQPVRTDAVNHALGVGTRRVLWLNQGGS